MLHLELSTEIVREQHRDRIAAAEQRRRIAELCGPRLALSRRVASPLGRALVRLGASLLRYSHAERPEITRRYWASARSIKLN